MARGTKEPVALNVEDVSLSTTTVCIKAVQVGSRQMTQSVFKQLPIFPTWELESINKVWGYVNFDPGDGVGRQFLVENSGRLFRCPVPLIPFHEVCTGTKIDLGRRLYTSIIPESIRRILYSTFGSCGPRNLAELRVCMESQERKAIFDSYAEKWQRIQAKLHDSEQLFIAC